MTLGEGDRITPGADGRLAFYLIPDTSYFIPAMTLGEGDRERTDSDGFLLDT